MSWSIELAAKLYRVELFDYGDHRSGTLIASGSGLAMAIMDSTTLRYAIDIDSMRGERGHVSHRLKSFAEMAWRCTHAQVTFAGWYSLHGNSVVMARAHEHLRDVGLYGLWYAGGEGGLSLAEYLAGVQRGQP